MNTPPSRESGLTDKAKHEVLERVLKALDSKFYKPELLGNDWKSAVTSHRAAIESAATPDAFEQAMTELLQVLKTSHLGFFHGTARRASSRAALSATYLSDETPYGSRWIFQDVHEGGAAARAGVVPGNVLLRVDSKDIVPPEHPVFPLGKTSTLEVVPYAGPGFVERSHRWISGQHQKVLQAIVRCRTAALGGHRDRCTDCGHSAISYNSCRNRHCPRCQGNARLRWLQQRERELLPTSYVHAVFTLPRELAPLALQNERVLYSLLFRASAEALQQVTRDSRHLGAEIGFFSVLHTWDQRLQHHPHILRYRRRWPRSRPCTLDRLAALLLPSRQGPSAVSSAASSSEG